MPCVTIARIPRATEAGKIVKGSSGILWKLALRFLGRQRSYGFDQSGVRVLFSSLVVLDHNIEIERGSIDDEESSASLLVMDQVVSGLC